MIEQKKFIFNKIEDCDVCKGTGKVEGIIEATQDTPASTQLVKCSKCSGSGSITKEIKFMGKPFNMALFQDTQQLLKDLDNYSEPTTRESAINMKKFEKEIDTDCELCNGKGTITTKKGHESSCKDCKGTGKIKTHSAEWSYYNDLFNKKKEEAQSEWIQNREVLKNIFEKFLVGNIDSIFEKSNESIDNFINVVKFASIILNDFFQKKN
jgi:RecJ-like exonuclease